MARSLLSPPEVEVLRLIAEGWSDRQIAAALGKALGTIHAHREHLFAKTGSHNRVQLTRYALACGYVPVAWESPEKMG